MMNRNTANLIMTAALMFFLSWSTLLWGAGRVVVFGLDVSESYKLGSAGKNTLISVIKQMEPGDTLYVRKINSTSYLDTAALFKLELPYVKAPSSLFNLRANRLYKRTLAYIYRCKARAIQVLSSLKLERSSKTDIWGFLIAASEILEESPQKIKILMIASDMKDNCGNRSRLNLKGVKVIVCGFQRGKNPRETMMLRQTWASIFRKAGAQEIHFLTVDQDAFSVLRRVSE